MFKNLKPAVHKKWLYLIAGLLWSGVGIMLDRLAVSWLSAADLIHAALFFLSGIAFSFVVFKFGFSKLALKNINRITLLENRPCIFAFQAWKSYFLIVVMVALGITLRHSSIPKAYLAILYTTIGSALFLASFSYYRVLWLYNKND